MKHNILKNTLYACLTALLILVLTAQPAYADAAIGPAIAIVGAGFLIMAFVALWIVAGVTILVVVLIKKKKKK